MKNRVKYIFSFLLCFVFLGANAQEEGGKRLRNSHKNPLVKTRISFSPALGIYKTNKNHTSVSKPKMAFCFSLKEEIRLNNKNTCFLMIGAEYMLHGLSFRSYYFADDSLKLYNGKMNAKYDLVIHEVDFPIQLKYSFQKENNTIFSSYIFGGYCYRWLVAAHMKVANNGNDIIDKEEPIKFKVPTFNSINSSFLNAGFGVQKNTMMKHNAVFAEIQFRYALSPFYFNESYAPTSMYINGHFIYLTIGFKF